MSGGGSPEVARQSTVRVPVSHHHHRKQPPPAMFSPALGRAFRSTSAIAATPASAVSRAAIGTAHQPFRPQRRLSSSKPSPPPDNSKAKRPTENGAEELKAAEKKTRRSSKSKAASASAPAAARNIPFVKPTAHLTEHHLVLSALFSQHRPMALSPAAEQSVPMPASMAQFEAVFQPQQRSESDLIVTTHKTLADFIQGVQASAEHYEALDALEEAAEDAFHLDSFAPPQPESLESYAFRPPPAPVPFDPLAAEEEATLPTTHSGRSKTFREHVRRRRSGMLLISVKRQRKLKMKKHKYKKLMKRTRLLRRKLDRL
ncbi:hypothetical protein C7974DRAFT_455442 [Boeremia exigua]|uniref:uncharacterized protein n=1 Tax=Boeremia exigua TaxID=749465 RepID=UPI001E8E882B|nr:uncharacterized protein C7974DRAFT_455442 [Boeremia exigua]KAH6625415.1 hypothetical protein C7974DRAFT_455442 [Boeremia exigua]